MSKSGIPTKVAGSVAGTPNNKLDHNLAPSFLVFLLGEKAAESGLHAEQWEQIGRNARTDHAFGFIAPDEVEALPYISADPLEDLVFVLPLEEIRG